MDNQFKHDILDILSRVPRIIVAGFIVIILFILGSTTKDLGNIIVLMILATIPTSIIAVDLAKISNIIMKARKRIE